MSKQTAVEWFAQQLGITSGTMLDQAKAMEREQMIDAYSNGWHDGQDVYCNNANTSTKEVMMQGNNTTTKHTKEVSNEKNIINRIGKNIKRLFWQRVEYTHKIG